MEATFNAAKSQYKSNYVEFALTGEQKYKKSYEEAKKTLDSVVSNAPEPYVPEPVKPIMEKSYKNHQDIVTIPSQSWKYWAIAALLFSTTLLGMF